MISKELLGCRAYKASDGNRKIIGKIVGHHANTQGSFFTILSQEGEFNIHKTSSIRITKKDMDVIYKTIIPERIESRSDILDL
jgi:hypothetical protein